MKKPWPLRFLQRRPEVLDLQVKAPPCHVLPYWMTRAVGEKTVSPAHTLCARPVAFTE